MFLLVLTVSWYWFNCVQVVGSESEVGGPSYMVNMDGLIATLQRRTIFSIASERFGFVSARIIGKARTTLSCDAHLSDTLFLYCCLLFCLSMCRAAAAPPVLGAAAGVRHGAAARQRDARAPVQALPVSPLLFPLWRCVLLFSSVIMLIVASLLLPCCL